MEVMVWRMKMRAAVVEPQGRNVNWSESAWAKQRGIDVLSNNYPLRNSTQNRWDGNHPKLAGDGEVIFGIWWITALFHCNGTCDQGRDTGLLSRSAAMTALKNNLATAYIVNFRTARMGGLDVGLATTTVVLISQSMRLYLQSHCVIADNTNITAVSQDKKSYTLSNVMVWRKNVFYVIIPQLMQTERLNKRCLHVYILNLNLTG